MKYLHEIPLVIKNKKQPIYQNYLFHHRHIHAYRHCVDSCIAKYVLGYDGILVQSKYEKTHHKLQQKTKLPPSCWKFCVDFKNKMFTKINRGDSCQILKYLLREKLLEKIAFYIFVRITKTNIYLQPVWFISITIPYKILCRWLDVWVPNYMKDFTQKYANSRENIFDFILLHGSIFVITLSKFNRYDWLMA